jgi:cell division protein FtsX
VIGIGPGKDSTALDHYGADVVAYTRTEGAPSMASMGPESTTAPATTEQAPAHRTVYVSLSRQPTEDDLRIAAEEEARANARDIWIGIIALCVTVIGITNSMLMSVTERFREIGTMRCLGAVSGFIRRLFLIESVLVGVFGAVGGAIGGAVFAIVVFGFRFGFAMVLGSLSYPSLLAVLGIAVGVGMVLSIVAALYPAGVAAKMVPATALRTNV